MVLEKIARAVDPHDAPLIEIGPGHGELTTHLLARDPNRTLIAIERDPRLVEQFRKKFSLHQFPNCSIIEGDVRRELPRILASTLPHSAPSVVGNIPYYLSGFLFRILGESEQKPARMVLTVQREIADRATAAVPHMNLLAVTLQMWARPSVLFGIPPESFSPPPKVRSAVLLLESVHPMPDLESLKSAFHLIRHLFRQPRKRAISNLGLAFPDRKASLREFFVSHSLSENARPQEISVEQAFLLARMFDS